VGEKSTMGRKNKSVGGKKNKKVDKKWEKFHLCAKRVIDIQIIQ
jgi:hypothetical protein